MVFRRPRDVNRSHPRHNARRTPWQAPERFTALTIRAAKPVLEVLEPAGGCRGLVASGAWMVNPVSATVPDSDPAQDFPPRLIERSEKTRRGTAPGRSVVREKSSASPLALSTLVMIVAASCATAPPAGLPPSGSPPAAIPSAVVEIAHGNISLVTQRFATSPRDYRAVFDKASTLMHDREFSKAKELALDAVGTIDPASALKLPSVEDGILYVYGFGWGEGKFPSRSRTTGRCPRSSIACPIRSPPRFRNGSIPASWISTGRAPGRRFRS